MNKDKISYLVRKYGVRGFPSFVYVKPKTNANVATKFQDNRTYEDMREWMEHLLILHGAKSLSQDDEDPVFLTDTDTESGYQEDDILMEIIAKIQRGEDLDSLFNDEVDFDQEDFDGDEDDEDDQELEIVSIFDATTGEDVPFNVDGEDFDRLNVERAN